MTSHWQHLQLPGGIIRSFRTHLSKKTHSLAMAKTLLNLSLNRDTYFAVANVFSIVACTGRFTLYTVFESG